MPSNALCRERLNRILSVLDRQGGSEALRQLERYFSIWRWEVNEAAALGWIEITTRKPRTGRPSLVASISKIPPAKLPPWRHEIKKPVSQRHQTFAMRVALEGMKWGPVRLPSYLGLGFASCWTEVYQAVYHTANSRAGARASASRLIRHPDVQAVMAWCKARIRGEISFDEDLPWVPAEIWLRLSRAGG
jgi:hypothetical protein